MPASCAPAPTSELEYIERARALAPVVRESADRAEQDRRLPDSVAKAMAEAQLYRVAAPRSVGGLETHPFTQIGVIEAISEADGATGWNLMIGIENIGFLGAALAPETANEIYADPLLVVCGALNALGRAQPVDGGFRVSGRWPFASGCHNAHYFWGQCMVYDGDELQKSPSGFPVLREAVVPRSEFEIDDTWHVSGMRGSGSCDVVVEDVFVPETHSTQVFGGPQRESGPLFSMPPFTRLAYNKVGVATGIARAAIDHFVALACDKTPRASSRLLRERTTAQLAVAEAETQLGSARAWVFEAIGEIYDRVVAGREVSREQRARAQLACSNAAAASVRAVESVCAAAGVSSNFTSSPLERCLRNVRVVPQHITVSPQWTEAAGRTLLGLDSGSPFF